MRGSHPDWTALHNERHGTIGRSRQTGENSEQRNNCVSGWQLTSRRWIHATDCWIACNAFADDQLILGNKETASEREKSLRYLHGTKSKNFKNAFEGKS
jgi:hypothetical protein